MSMMVSFCAVLFSTRCLGWDLELYWVSFWGFSFLLLKSYIAKPKRSRSLWTVQNKHLSYPTHADIINDTNLSVRLESSTPVRISDRHGVSKHHFQNGPVPLRFTTGDDLINWSLSVRMRSVPVRFWGDLQALFLVLWAVNIQELSPNSIARLCVCLPIIPELSKCDLPWKFLYLGRREGLACTTKT